MECLLTLEKDSSQLKIEETFFLRGYPANVWVVGNNPKGALWIADKNGVFKTKSEAQALVDAEIQAAQAAWDAQTDEQKADPINIRPSDITLP